MVPATSRKQLTPFGVTFWDITSQSMLLDSQFPNHRWFQFQNMVFKNPKCKKKIQFSHTHGILCIVFKIILSYISFPSIDSPTKNHFSKFS